MKQAINFAELRSDHVPEDWDPNGKVDHSMTATLEREKTRQTTLDEFFALDETIASVTLAGETQQLLNMDEFRELWELFDTLNLEESS